eukprot:s1053_g3.t1
MQFHPFPPFLLRVVQALWPVRKLTFKGEAEARMSHGNLGVLLLNLPECLLGLFQLLDAKGLAHLRRCAHIGGHGAGTALSRAARDTLNLEDISELPPMFGREHRPVAQTSVWLSTPETPDTPRSRSESKESAGPQQLLIMKFGGTSVGGGEQVLRCAGIVRKALPSRPVVVVSAMGKTTNALLSAAKNAVETGEVDISAIRKMHESVIEHIGIDMPTSMNELLNELERILNGVALLKEISTQTRDRIVSFGERLSVRAFAAAFNRTKGEEEVEARPVDAWQIGMRTTSGSGSADSAFSSVEILDETFSAIQHHLGPLKLNYAYVPIVTGYIAKDTKGVITTLGRDGSDLTATVIGAALKAAEVQIWKDVSGVQTTDPRVIPSAKPVRVLTFEEAAELSTFGSKVVHPAAVLPAWQAGVPMSVRNSMAPEDPGTRIVPKLSGGDTRERRVAAISSKNNITMIVSRLHLSLFALVFCAWGFCPEFA